ncbi:MAG TPA: hypothetical protein VGQ99_22820 [Tepidisphaeraceae bacterium]|jgi:hypothetical protein|nr:hypothetical protein [Tepidisphaeraceae bacterium]
MMSEEWPYKFPARVICHLNGGFTGLSVDLPAHAQVDEIEIPTEAIPANLRRIGSDFLLVFDWMSPENRSRCSAGQKIEATYSVEELSQRTDTKGDEVHHS